MERLREPMAQPFSDEDMDTLGWFGNLMIWESGLTNGDG